MKKMIILFGIMALGLVLAACGGGGGGAAADPIALVGTDEIFRIPLDTEGEITIMMWSGSGTFIEDAGRRNITPDELFAQNDAAMVASARAFNQIFPNIQINVYAREGGPNANYISWDQYRQNFQMEFGHYPDIFAVYNLVDDVMRGLVADLSIFHDDPMMQAFNPAVMELMNIGGRQFGIPQYLLPWGVFVNRSLAEARNLDMPSPQWTFDEYMRFVNNHSPGDFYGAMGAPRLFIDSGTRDFHYQIMNRQEGEPFVNLNSDAVRGMLARMPETVQHTVWTRNALGLIDPEFMDAHWWWGHRFFQQGRLLVNPGDPWMMGDLAQPGTDGTATMADWDIFPRPATAYVGNHVGIVLDPFAIYNFAMLDGDPLLNEYEYHRLSIAWTFAKFMTGDTRAWEARSTQLYSPGDGGQRIAANDSFPFVMGQAFDDQMELWYAGGRSRFADPHLMPGFHYMLELWQDGAFTPFSDKAVPWRHEFDGVVRLIAYEWNHIYADRVAGVTDMDPAWLDMVLSRLPDWNNDINARFADAFVELYAAIEQFYPEQTRPSLQ